MREFYSLRAVAAFVSVILDNDYSNGYAEYR